jgi:hypothetical protein
MKLKCPQAHFAQTNPFILLTQQSAKKSTDIAKGGLKLGPFSTSGKSLRV